MTSDDADDPKAARAARLKAALKANMGRRKAQARARDVAPSHPDDRGRRAEEEPGG